MTSWNASTDPCDDAWRGIECTCSHPNGAFTNCTAPPAGSPKRIIQVPLLAGFACVLECMSCCFAWCRCARHCANAGARWHQTGRKARLASCFKLPLE